MECSQGCGLRISINRGCSPMARFSLRCCPEVILFGLSTPVWVTDCRAGEGSLRSAFETFSTRRSSFRTSTCGTRPSLASDWSQPACRCTFDRGRSSPYTPNEEHKHGHEY